MKRVKQYSYLGDMLSKEGVAASALATVVNRFGKANHAIFEIRSIINDCRSNVIEGFCAAVSIWEMSVIPYLLNSAEHWVDLHVKAPDKLNKLQETFYRTLLAVGQGCPTPCLY